MFHERINLLTGEKADPITDWQIARERRPILESYVLEGKTPRGAVVVCPGGGYMATSPREGEPVAVQFLAAGYHAFVLHYRVHPDTHPAPLADLSKTLGYIRAHAGEWSVDPDRIAVCGFSAGGHLAASLGAHWNEDYLCEAASIDKGANRPDAMILCYAATSPETLRRDEIFEKILGSNNRELLDYMACDRYVGAHTPPAFIWHTYSDELVPVENATVFAEAMRRAGRPFELHVYPDGQHGLSLATKETSEGMLGSAHVATWMPLAVQWLDGLWGE